MSDDGIQSDEEVIGQGVPRLPTALLCHPLVLLSIVVCGVNDHLLKGSGLLPGIVTGKLSDVAGLFFFPILVAVLLTLTGAALRQLFGDNSPAALLQKPRLVVDFAVVFTIVGFSAVNISHWANEIAAQYWGIFTMDPTDLFCLPMVVVARQFMLGRVKARPLAKGKQPRRRRLKLSHLMAIVAASLVSLGTPAPPKTITAFPMWEIADPVIICPQDVEIRSWFAKSGKEGAGLVLRFENLTDGTRTVAVPRAQMFVGESEESDQPAELVVDAKSIPRAGFTRNHSVYLPFAFDNQRAWNRQWRHATVVIEVEIDGEILEVSYQAVQRSAPYYERYDRRQSVEIGDEVGFPRLRPVDSEMSHEGRLDESQILLGHGELGRGELEHGEDSDESRQHRIRFEQNARDLCDRGQR